MTSKFEQALTKTLNNEVSMTENGAYAFATSGKKLLDLHFATSSLRNKTDSEIEQMFETALLETPLLSVKWLFMARDIREGMGERRTFRVCLKWLAASRPELVKKLIPLVAEYGRYDDLFCLIGTSLSKMSLISLMSRFLLIIRKLKQMATSCHFSVSGCLP